MELDVKEVQVEGSNSQNKLSIKENVGKNLDASFKTQLEGNVYQLKQSKEDLAPRMGMEASLTLLSSGASSLPSWSGVS